MVANLPWARDSVLYEGGAQLPTTETEPGTTPLYRLIQKGGTRCLGAHSCLSNLASGDTGPASSGLHLSPLVAAGGQLKGPEESKKSLGDSKSPTQAEACQ